LDSGDGEVRAEERQENNTGQRMRNATQTMAMQLLLMRSGLQINMVSRHVKTSISRLARLTEDI
jgi:hypothetical protein